MSHDFWCVKPKLRGALLEGAVDMVDVYADVSVFGFWNGNLSTLLVRPTNESYGGRWVPPFAKFRLGQKVDPSIAAVQSAVGEVLQLPVQVAASYERRAADRAVSIVYATTTRAEPVAPDGKVVAEIRWFNLSSHPPFDERFEAGHQESLSRLRELVHWGITGDRRYPVDTKARQASRSVGVGLLTGLLPPKFSLSSLEGVARSILPDIPGDSSNFRKQILATEMFQDTGEKRVEGRHRSATQYRVLDEYLDGYATRLFSVRSK
jgi:8-oxo-dGTP diphosphatase